MERMGPKQAITIFANHCCLTTWLGGTVAFCVSRAARLPLKYLRYARRLCTMPPQISDRLVWIDLEMTGLDPERDRILEAACVVTDGALRPLEPGLQLVVHEPESVLRSMNAWCVEHHGRSGLTEAVRRSTISLAEAEQTLLSYVRRLTPAGQCPLAGNSVHMDRVFLMKYMPRLLDHLHYRIVDVSTLKELARRWRPELHDAGRRGKKCAHRALDDIQESIAELRLYREKFIRA
ncbi:probable oligoribonuclease isoform X2 [Amphibalanus amphitrite]|uniref:probable oligoribonuclease isoform X2 n=1 Tax=Amphibalanus amphitrite TaxID=1232801 RepID=UPI001C8FF2DB|nr:probable oligoribonuclease isoform X2 [Amphibalanus amphitrite]